MALNNILKNLTLFVDGRGYAGKVTELEPPKLTIKTSEHRAGGMDAPIEIDMGMEKLETTFTLNGYNPDTLKLFGLTLGANKTLTIRGSMLDNTTGIELPIIINLRGRFKEVDMGTWKPGDDATLKMSMAVSYYKLTHGSTVICEIDPEGMIRVVDGIDQLALTRANLGLI